MHRSRFTEEQIIAIVRESEGTTVAKVAVAPLRHANAQLRVPRKAPSSALSVLLGLAKVNE